VAGRLVVVPMTNLSVPAAHPRRIGAKRPEI
jgi:hypothetical protein